MLKKIILTLISITFLIALTACSSNNQAQNTTSATNNTIVKKSGDGFRFIVGGDTMGFDNGVNSKATPKLLEQMKKLSPQPDFAMILGDTFDGSDDYGANKSQLDHLKKVLTKYYPLDFFFPGLGNHESPKSFTGEKNFGDAFSNVKASFLDGFNKTVYYFDYGDSRFFMLNTDHPGEQHLINGRQLDWLKFNIDPSKKHNFFFLHEPAFPVGDHLNDSLDVNKFQRDRFWEIVDNSKGPMVFAAHEHIYSRRHINSDFNEIANGVEFKFNKTIYQITTGGLGEPLHKLYKDTKNVDVPPISKYHFTVVDVDSSKINITAIDIDGKIIDEFELTN